MLNDCGLNSSRVLLTFVWPEPSSRDNSREGHKAGRDAPSPASKSANRYLSIDDIVVQQISHRASDLLLVERSNRRVSNDNRASGTEPYPGSGHRPFRSRRARGFVQSLLESASPRAGIPIGHWLHHPLAFARSGPAPDARAYISRRRLLGSGKFCGAVAVFPPY